MDKTLKLTQFKNRYQLILDTSTVFFRTYTVSGWIRPVFLDQAQNIIDSMINKLDAPQLIDVDLEIPEEYDTVKIKKIFQEINPSKNILKGVEFQVQFSVEDINISENIFNYFLNFIISSKTNEEENEIIHESIENLNKERIFRYENYGLLDKLNNLLLNYNSRNFKKDKLSLIDIGGRARSGINLWLKKLEKYDVTVIDILPDEGVDIVCDAHYLSDVGFKDKFDGVISNSVFEHLHSPWKCAIEMNKIMNMGGIGLIMTHQTIGIHDYPCDYFRFSKSSWKSLFNETTGFKILESSQDFPSYIIPFIHRPEKKNSEKSAGFESSWVLIEKISETNQNWEINKELDLDDYPDVEDNSIYRLKNKTPWNFKSQMKNID